MKDKIRLDKIIPKTSEKYPITTQYKRLKVGLKVPHWVLFIIYNYEQGKVLIATSTDWSNDLERDSFTSALKMTSTKIGNMAITDGYHDYKTNRL